MNYNGTDFMRNVGNRITELREKRKLLQSDVAEKMGIKREILSYWENGMRTPKITDIVDLAEILDTSCDYLLSGIDNANLNIAKETGLNNASINALKELSNKPEYTHSITGRFVTDYSSYILSDTLSRFLSSEGLLLFAMELAAVYHHKQYTENLKKDFEKCLQRFHIKIESDIMRQAAMLFVTTEEIDIKRAAEDLIEQNKKYSFELYRLNEQIKQNITETDGSI